MSDPDEMTPSEVATYLDVSTATVRRMAIKGILTPCRVFPGSGYRRYARVDVEALKQSMSPEKTSSEGEEESG